MPTNHAPTESDPGSLIPASADSPGGSKPAEPGARLITLDAARGLALLGILCVNAMFFALPFGDVMNPKGPADASFIDRTAWFIVHTFAEGKFYPIFSMLFGYGLALQLERVRASGRSAGWFGVRRLSFLIIVGLLHATLLWYGDILFLYGTIGMLLLVFIRARAQTLFITGGVLLLVSTMCMTGFAGLSAMSSAAQQAAQQQSPVDPESVPSTSDATAGTPKQDDEGSLPSEPRTPMERFWNEMASGRMGDPSSPVWRETEIEVYRHGPYSQALLMRCFSWLMMLLVTGFTFGWHIMAMFMFGAGAAKLGVLDADRSAWHRRMATIGLAVGVPGAMMSTLVPHMIEGAGGLALSAMLLTLLGPALSLGYIGCMALVAQSRSMGAVGRAFAVTGRMAFTNYLTQTVVMTFIMYHWGLAKFASVGRAELLLLSLVVYGVQMVVSHLWLSRYRFGPLEWIWRAWTYGRAEPIRRGV